ncbi:MAG: AMP-binding protein [Desulfatiglans sp.]|jgi:long-chain acyl-CoA synthetase|nr:AMP-binding protein [Desulfatiglans sp.]
MALDTLPKLLRENFRKYGNTRVAMREKDRGIWIRYTWEDYYYKVRYLSLGLIRLGLKRNDKVSVLGENSPEWYCAELAAQSAGAQVVGIFTDCIPSEVKYYLEHSDSTFILSHDQEQVDKVLQIKEELPLLAKIIYWDEKGLWSYKEPLLISFDEVLDLGKEYDREHPEMFESNIDKGCGDDIGVICYTSGTTGLPKGAMLDQNWLVEGMRQWSEMDEWLGRDYEYLSFIPPAWSTEQGMGIAGSLLAGLTVNFPEEPETVQDDLREISPQVLFYGARLWETVNRMIHTKILDASFLKRLTYRIFMPVGYRVAQMEEEGRRPSLWWRVLRFTAFWVLFRPLRDKLGLKRVEVVYSAGAAVSPDIIRFFRAIGIEIKLYYGSTEAGLISIPRRGEIRPETSGRIVPWVKLKLSEEGEILIKSRFMYVGYYKNPEASQKKIKDGWYCTGDFGHMDEDGHLIVIDRMDDLKELAGGRKFSPQFIEIRLRFSSYIKDCLAVGGEEREFVSVLVNIDLDSVGKWAEDNRIPYTTFTDLSQKPEVLDLVREEIVKINRTLPEESRIRKFVNMYKEFDPDESEMTRTRKLRRSFVEDRFSDLIAACYGDEETLEVSVPVTYQDGRKGTLESIVRVATI